MHSEFTQRKIAKHKATSRDKVSRRNMTTIVKKPTWKQRRNVLLSEKGLQLIADITPPVINHLSWYGAVCSCPSFGV